MSDHPHSTESDDASFDAAAFMRALIRGERPPMSDDEDGTTFDPSAVIRRARGI